MQPARRSSRPPAPVLKRMRWWSCLLAPARSASLDGGPGSIQLGSEPLWHDIKRWVIKGLTSARLTETFACHALNSSLRTCLLWVRDLFAFVVCACGLPSAPEPLSHACGNCAGSCTMKVTYEWQSTQVLAMWRRVRSSWLTVLLQRGGRATALSIWSNGW